MYVLIVVIGVNYYAQTGWFRLCHQLLRTWRDRVGTNTVAMQGCVASVRSFASDLCFASLYSVRAQYTSLATNDRGTAPLLAHLGA